MNLAQPTELNFRALEKIVTWAWEDEEILSAGKMDSVWQ